MKISIKISPSVYNPSFRHLLDCDTRFLILYGGGGSGKSYFIAERYIERMLTRKMNLLVVRNTGLTNRDSTFALLKQIISKWHINDQYEIFRVQESTMRIKCINGNEIAFAGLDDVEKLKSVTFSSGEATDIWIEEASEISESDFNQLNLRLRGGKSNKQIVLSFNPIDINHWLKKRFIDIPSEDVTIHHSTYKDNEFLDEAYKRELEGFKTTDPYYYSVYCLGEWGVLGNSIFDKEAISLRLQHIPEPVSVGLFEYEYDGLRLNKWHFLEDKGGYIRIYEHPIKGMQYVLASDTAGDGSDWFVGQVLDEYGHQVCVIRQQMDADLYTKQIYCLGMYYNMALQVPEVNFDTFIIKELERLGYTHMYVREVQDTFTGAIKKAFGFRTDSLTRPRIISQLVEIVREHTELFNDKTTLEEMLTFVRNEKGRPEAQVGAHDDCVMSIAIAHEGMKQLKPMITLQRVPDADEEFFAYGS